MLVPKKTPWAPLLHSLDKFTDDFMDERKHPIVQNIRKNFS